MAEKAKNSHVSTTKNHFNEDMAIPLYFSYSKYFCSLEICQDPTEFNVPQSIQPPLRFCLHCLFLFYLLFFPFQLILSLILSVPLEVMTNKNET